MKEAFEYCSKCLFTASENVRECLDTLDLKGLSIGPLTASELERVCKFLEQQAQQFQKIARS